MKNDLSNIIRRVEKLEKAVFASGGKKSPKTKLTGDKSTLRSRVLDLRDANFFKQPKIASEVHTKLQATYSCDLNRVEVILLRISKKKLLRVTLKVVDGKKKKAYVW